MEQVAKLQEFLTTDMNARTDENNNKHKVRDPHNMFYDPTRWP